MITSRPNANANSTSKQENVLKILRVESGMTQEQLARAINATRLLVLRSEQGVYAMPPPHLVSFLARSTNTLMTYEEIIETYRLWQQYNRRLHGPKNDPVLIWPFERALSLSLSNTPVAGSSPSDPASKPVLAHPLARLRTLSNVSQIGLCISLCINPGPIHKYEAWKQRTMPSQLLVALRDAGYSEEDIQYLDQLADKEYRDR